MTLRRPPLPALLLPALLGIAPAAVAQGKTSCAPGNGGLTLPAGFCAAVLAEDAGEVRQLAVAPGGILYAAVREASEGVLALRDRDGDGRVEERTTFGPGPGNDVEVRDGYLYFAQTDRVVRWRLPSGGLEPEEPPETIVQGLPDEGNHREKSLAFGTGGVMYVAIGSASNSCQRTDRQAGSPGREPCRELERHAGVWVFDADRPGQWFADGRRYATGLRNALALAVQPATGRLFAAVHGRDQLGDNWGFSDEANAENPAEELVTVERGDDFGWPYCYYSSEYRKKVLAPEYGGDGRKVGRCAEAKAPVVDFPAHWAPLALAFYTADAFGPEYARGLFVAFHGSWNRAPLPQSGYRVAFVPFEGGAPSADFQTFAIGGPTPLRASGLAVGADGSLFIAGDANGRIWKVVRR
jgi:glucose/arabinose dehydrogenase